MHELNSIRVHHIKTRSLAKCVLNVLLLIVSPTASHVPSCNRYIANLVDPVLTAFDWISVYHIYCTS